MLTSCEIISHLQGSDGLHDGKPTKHKCVTGGGLRELYVTASTVFVSITKKNKLKSKIILRQHSAARKSVQVTVNAQ